MTTEDARYLCVECWGFIPHGRVKLGYRLCLDCGEAKAKKETHCVVPMPKSNYIVVTDPTLLKGLNSSHKGGAA